MLYGVCRWYCYLIFHVPTFQELVGEFAPFKEKLDNLRTKGSDLIKHTSDPVEKHSIQKSLADTNRSWSSVQKAAGEKTKELREADKLAKEFAQSCDAVERWINEAEARIDTEPGLVDFDKVREQLKQNKVCVLDKKCL